MRSIKMHGKILMKIDERLVLASLILTSTAFPLELIGFVIPGWYYAKYTAEGAEIRVFRGLWYSVECQDGDCQILANTDITGLSDSYLKYQIMCTVATGFALLALGTELSHRRSVRADGTKHWLRVISFIGSSISGVLALVSSAINTNVIIRGHGDVLRPEDKDSAQLPFACIVFGLGGLVSCCASVAIFIVVVRHPLNLEDEQLKQDVESESNEIYIFGEGENIEPDPNHQSTVAIFPDNGHVSQGKEVHEIVLHPELEVISQPQTYNAVTVTPQRIVYAPAQDIRATVYAKPYYTELYHYPSVQAPGHAPRRYYSNRQSTKQLQVLGAL